MEEPLSPTIVIRMEKAIDRKAKNWTLHLLDWRFGKIERKIGDQILALTQGQAEQLAKDALIFASKDDLTAWLANPPKVEETSPFADYWAEYNEDAQERLNFDYEVTSTESKKE